MEEINLQTSEGEQKNVPSVEPKTEVDGSGNTVDSNSKKPDRNNRTGSKILLTLLECVDAVHELTGLNWEEIFRIAAMDFLAYVNFWNYKQRKAQKALDDFKRKNKVK